MKNENIKNNHNSRQWSAVLYQLSGPRTRLLMEIISHLKNKKWRQAFYKFEWFYNILERRVWNSGKVKCQLCGWKGNRFFRYTSTYNGECIYTTPGELCPHCLSKSRYRILLYYINVNCCINTKSTRLKVLDVSPVSSFRLFMLEQKQVWYVTSNIIPTENITMDLQYVAFKDGIFDIIFCYHVLEHVKDDILCLRELNRVLSEDGIIFLQVPIDMNQEKTIEYDAPVEKWHGHIRAYGQDYLIRLQKAGFKIDQDALWFHRNLDRSICRRYGFTKDDIKSPFIVCSKNTIGHRN